MALMPHWTHKDAMLEIARGFGDGIAHVNKFGANPSSAAGAEEDAWDLGGTYPWATSATITHIRQAADDIPMRGATIRMCGLSASWVYFEQTQTLNAADTSTLVALDTPMLRICRMIVEAPVVATQNVQAVNAAATIVYAQITNGFNQTLMAFYTVPVGHTAYITQYYGDVTVVTGADPKSVEFNLYFADRLNDFAFALKHKKAASQNVPTARHEFKPYLKVAQQTDIKIATHADTSSGHIHAGFDLIVVDKVD